MAKLTRCNKKYFKGSENLYMVCTALNKDGKYRWEIHTSDSNGVYVWFNEFAHGVYWEDFPEDAINEAIEVFNIKFPNATEVNFTEGNLCLAGNFKDNVELKEEVTYDPTFYNFNIYKKTNMKIEMLTKIDE